MYSADTNLFLYAANPESPHHEKAARFFATCHQFDEGFATCELVLVEIYMLLRNPAVLKRPLAASAAADFCERLRQNPNWQHLDYHCDVSPLLWRWATGTTSSFRRIIDARLALTLQIHGVTHFATANSKDFTEFGFTKAWNPLDPE